MTSKGKRRFPKKFRLKPSPTNGYFLPPWLAKQIDESGRLNIPVPPTSDTTLNLITATAADKVTGL